VSCRLLATSSGQGRVLLLAGASRQAKRARGEASELCGCQCMAQKASGAHHLRHTVAQVMRFYSRWQFNVKLQARETSADLITRPMPPPNRSLCHQKESSLGSFRMCIPCLQGVGEQCSSTGGRARRAHTRGTAMGWWVGNNPDTHASVNNKTYIVCLCEQIFSIPVQHTGIVLFF
jgi:hypothetical protein